MAKGNLDQVVRALVGVEPNYLGVVRDIANRLNSADALRWHNRFTNVLQEGLPELEPSPPLFVFDDAHVATVDLSGLHVPKEFWQTTRDSPPRDVWTNIFSKAKVIEMSGIVKVPYADTSRTATVREILATPGVGNHEVDKLSKLIAKMIARQPNGEFMEDGLLVDGKLNGFPCGSVLVGVRWNDVSRGWSVSDWDPGYGVGADGRVFSGNLKI